MKSFWSSNSDGRKDAAASPLSCSTPASPPTPQPPTEKSAFMFFSKSQVILPRATSTEPGAKAALACVPARTHTGVCGRCTHCHACAHTHRSMRTMIQAHSSSLRRCSPCQPTHALPARTHTPFDCLHAVAVIKTH